MTGCPMARTASWMLVLALAGCGGAQVAPAGNESRRFADYDGTSTPAADSQCHLPVEQRDKGWFCSQGK